MKSLLSRSQCVKISRLVLCTESAKIMFSYNNGRGHPCVTSYMGVIGLVLVIYRKYIFPRMEYVHSWLNMRSSAMNCATVDDY